MPAEIQVTRWVCPFPSRGFLRRAWSAVAAMRHQGDVNHVTGDVHFLTYFLDRRRTILTVHDCIMVERARGLKRLLLWSFWLWLPEKRCARIVAISEEGKRRILRQVNCRPDKIVVVHNPVSDSFRPVEKPFNAKGPRILQVGTKANKNIERLAEALHGLDVTLVIVGPLSAMQKAVLDRHGIRAETTPRLTDDEIRGEYERCDILAFCSTAEGFGLPIIEAQGVGRPVVASGIPPITEVAGDAASYADPLDPHSIRRAFRAVIENAEFRADLVRKGFENMRRFRSAAVAARYAALYHEIAENARGRT